jgi:oxepin-CoA hydrolase/3-oxo-5,6-dehydrosuberyl-CoA semialdehyde dehydrogenase
MPDIFSYVQGSFATDRGDFVDLVDPTTEAVVARACCGGLDLPAALEYARTRGLSGLAAMSFPARAELLAAMAALIHERRDELIESSIRNGGATRGGAKFDIDGASGTLAAYAALGKVLGEGSLLGDGEGVGLGRGARLFGRHAHGPRAGVAVLINAFNFPTWGFAEKAACALLAGMPVINKPATATSWTSGQLAKMLVDADLLPEGAFQQVLGPVTALLEAVGPLDVVSFTGSSGTAAKVRGLASLLTQGVHINVEADSLNAAVLAPDTDTEGAAYQLFLRDVHREMTEKTGQKCTAIRRLVVPEDMVERVAEDLAERVQTTVIGDPSASEVTMGPLSTRQQHADVLAGIERLKGCCTLAFGGGRPSNLVGVEGDKGFFVAPTLLIARDAAALEEVHREEVFGPVQTILPYDGERRTAIDLVSRGGGMLVSSVYGDDRRFLMDVAQGIAPYCGRVCMIDPKAEGYSLPTGMVLPQLIHGGPGRAGGGEELGGLRGVHHFMRRTAFQGTRALIDKMF